MKILIADDDIVLSHLFSFFLKQEGHGIETANDCPSAMEAVSDLHPDVVLLDVNMPNGSGLEVLRDIMKAKTSRRPSIIVISADPGMERPAKDFGAHSFLCKPVDIQHLLGVVGKMQMQQDRLSA